MIGPVSQTGRTMLASLQQAISKGMPVDQAIAYVKSMANDGVAPLVDLYALMKQFERMKQQPTPALQTPNIREQLNMLEASRGQGQAGLPAAMPPQNPQAMMSQGLGGLPAGRMESPQFAGGGIVAFAGEGDSQVTDSSKGAPSITPEFYSQVPKFKTWDEAAAAYRAQLENPQLVQQEMARREALAQQYQMGEYAPSFKMREQMLADQKAEAERTAEEESAYDRDEYWGDVAANAAERGATLLSSLAKAQKGKAVRKRATAEKARAAINAAKQAELLLQQAKEAERAGRFKDAEALRAEAKRNALVAQGKQADAAETEAEANRALSKSIKLKQTEGPVDALEQARRRLLNAEPGSEEAEQAQDVIQAMSPSAGRMPSRYAQALSQAQRALDTALKNSRDPVTGKVNEKSPEVIAARNKLRDVQNDIMAKGFDLPGVSPTAGAPAAAPAADAGGCSEADIIAGVPGCA